MGAHPALDAGLPIGASDEAAIETAGSVWTWGDVAGAADALAGRLTELAAPSGTLRVGHVCDLSPAAIVSVHAVARAGAVLAPAHIGWNADQVENWVVAVRPDAVLVTAGQSWPGPWVRHAVPLPGFGPLDLLTTVEDDRSPGAARPRQGPAWGAPAGTDVMITTSGSGGAPRVVCHSWAGLRANARASNRRGEGAADSVTLATLAWAHIGGLAIIVRSAEGGGRIVCGPTHFDATASAVALTRHGITHASVVPIMLERLLDTAGRPPPTLRRILTGGAATSEPLVSRALEAGWPISLTYGLTEAGSQVATTTPEEVAGGVAVLDRPLDGVEIRLGEGGEVLVRGPSLLLGYLDGAPAVDPDGWLTTGDFATLDETGSARITGRRSSRIVTGGSNVDAEEVEAVLREHDDIDEVCVVGVADERWGEIVTAVVVPRTVNAPDLGAALDVWARERLGGPRRPRRWVIVERLPRTPTGKVDRMAVRAAC